MSESVLISKKAKTTVSATLEDGSVIELICNATHDKAVAAMEAALMVLDTPIVYRKPIGLVEALGKWFR